MGFGVKSEYVPVPTEPLLIQFHLLPSSEPFFQLQKLAPAPFAATWRVKEAIGTHYSNLGIALERVFDDSGRFGGFETHLLGQPAITACEQQGKVQQDPIDSEVFWAEIISLLSSLAVRREGLR